VVDGATVVFIEAAQALGAPIYPDLFNVMLDITNETSVLAQPPPNIVWYTSPPMQLGGLLVFIAGIYVLTWKLCNRRAWRWLRLKLKRRSGFAKLKCLEAPELDP
jgi:hypothetical protein